MADENKPAFYPRVGNIKAKNFKSAQPMPFVEDPRAMDLPQYGDIDLSVPTKENLEMGRRMAERDAQLRRQQQADRSPLEKLAGGVQAGRLMGSALAQSVASIPTALRDGSKAADEYIAQNMYKPTQPLAYEYAQDVGDFLEKLETEYKIPPILPEAMALQFLTGPGTSQAARAAGKGAVKAGRAIESRMEPVVRGALEQGGLPREMALGMGANTQSNVIKPVGGNWMQGTLDTDLRPLKRNTAGGNDTGDVLRQMNERYTPEVLEGMQEGSRRNIVEQIDTLEKMDALNKWVDSNLKNYVKKQMGTPSDPVRKLAEEGIIHMPTNEVGINRYSAPLHRRMYGGDEVGQSEAARAWEDAADVAITPTKIKDLPNEYREFWMESADPNTIVSHLNRNFDPSGLGFDHIMDVLRQDLVSGRIRPDQLNKVSMEQAVRRTYEYDQEMAKEMQKVALERQEGFPVQKEYPEGYKWIELTKPKYEVLEENLPAGYSLRKSDDAYENQKWQVVDEKGLPAAEYVKANFNSKVGDPKLKALENFFDKKSNKQLKDALDYEGKAMGHCVGSYCDEVSEGNKKIYTLRDKKGEPHVTIEVTPSDEADAFYEANKKWLNNPVYRRELDLMQDPDLDIPLSEQYVIAARKLLTEAGIKFNEPAPRPPVIKQIKGKQNRAPKEEYLPYVQDFVRSGNWTDVYDLQNSGLKTLDEAFPNYEDAKFFANAYPNKKYVSQAEIDAHNLEVNQGLINEYAQHRLMPDPQSKATKGRTEPMTIRELAELEFPGDIQKQANMIRGALQGQGGILPPLEGMKRGGKVSISKNPDTMMLEVNNQKMKNGVPAYGAGKAVTKQSLKAAKPEVMKASEALGKIEGRPLKITQADRTKVGGGYLGGPGFSGLQLTEPEYRAAEAAWAVQNAGTAKTILGGGGDNAVYAAMIGTPTQHQSNQMVFDKLYGDFKKAAKRGELTPELRDMINMRLAAAVDKKGNPVFPSDVDIMDKKFRDIADTFSRRSIAGHLMGGVQVGGKKGQIIDYDKIIRNTTDPALIDLPTGSIGNRLFTLSGGIIDRPDLHPAFPAILQGEDLGLTFSPVERDIVMKDFVAKTMREKGRKPGYMDYSRGNPPTQLITEDILTEMQKLGLKKGGAVKKAEGGYLKKPAAYINGDEFVNAAKKYGIKDSMNNLNKIVDLVNKGLSVDDAARQVADSGMHKAAGGAISGDDLILEERPL